VSLNNSGSGVLNAVAFEFDILNSMYKELNPLDYTKSYNRYIPLFPGDTFTFTYKDLPVKYKYYTLDYSVMDVSGLMDLDVDYESYLSVDGNQERSGKLPLKTLPGGSG